MLTDPIYLLKMILSGYCLSAIIALMSWCSMVKFDEWRQIRVQMFNLGNGVVKFYRMDGTVMSSNFNKLCNHGIKFIFGRDAFMPESAVVIFYSRTAEETEKIVKNSHCTKTKRFYLDNEQGAYRLWFGFGIHTDIVFDPLLETTEVMRWLDVLHGTNRKHLDISARVENA